MEKEIFEEPEELEEEELEEPEGSEGNPGPDNAALETLREEVRELSAKVSANPDVENILENEAFQRLVRDANTSTLERIIEETPGLDEGAKKALAQTLERMRHESAPGDDDEPEPELSEGERCLELRSRIRTLDEELEGLEGERAAFTPEGKKERARDRKLIALLEAEREKSVEELEKILAVPDAEPEEDPDDKWSR